MMNLVTILQIITRRIGFRSDPAKTSVDEARRFPGFDEDFYLSRNPDVRDAGLDPQHHFMAFGWNENRDPSRGFCVAAYLDANPDVREAGINPLVHYIEYGMAEGRALQPDQPPSKHQVVDPETGARIDRFHRADPNQRARLV